MKGSVFMAERLTWDQMTKKYPNQWIAIVEPEWINSATIASGIVKYTEQDMSRDEMALGSFRGQFYATHTNPDAVSSVGALTL